MNKDLQVRTANVLSVYRSSTLQNLIQLTQDYRTDLLAVQEVRWLGRSIIERMYCIIYYSCDYKQHFFEQASLLVNILDQDYFILNLLIGECMWSELEGNLKIIASSVHMLQQRKRVTEKIIGFMRD
jgi:hypothetical protein